MRQEVFTSFYYSHSIINREIVKKANIFKPLGLYQGFKQRYRGL